MGAFDDYKAPSSGSNGGGAFSDYNPPTLGGKISNALFKEASGSRAPGTSADEGVVPALRDYGLAGLDDVTMGLGPKLLGLTGAAQQAQQNLGPMSYVTGAAAYGLGPGKILGPVGKAIGAYSPIAKGLAGAATEGALAGGISNAVQGGNPLSGAATGAVLGGAGSAIGKGIGKAFDRPGTVDPAAAVASTKTARDQAYAPLQNIVFNPNDVLGAHTSTMLSPGMKADISPGINTMLRRQQQAILNKGNTANDIADYVSNLRTAGGSPNASSGDRILMGQTANNLEGLLSKGQPISGQAPGDAMQVLTQARQANAQYENAKALQQLQQQLRDFGQGPGGVPQKQAETYYKPGSPEYQAWADISKAGQKGLDPSFVAGHFGGEIGESLGTLAMGFPGYVVGKGLGYLTGKLLGKKALASRQNRGLMNAYQEQYPTLTGVQSTGGTQASPAIGDMVKNLMLGGAY